MEAAGLASSIITFIDFSYKLINGTVVTYKKSASGPAADPHISNVINDLRNVTTDMTAAASSVDSLASQSSAHHQELHVLAAGCKQLSEELLATLKDLERKDGAKVLRSFQAAWKTLRSSSKITEMEQELNTYRLQLVLHLDTMLVDNGASIKRQLDRMQQGHERASSETILELRSVQDSIKELQSILQAQADQVLVAEDCRGELASIHRLLKVIHQKSPANLQILSRLRFDRVHTRFDAISDGDFGFISEFLAENTDTVDQGYEGHGPESSEDQYSDDKGSEEVSSQHKYSVQLDSEEQNSENRDSENQDTESQDSEKQESDSERREMSMLFVLGTTHQEHACQILDDWLESEGKVLHVSGKAGSGKSTLMKLLSRSSALKGRLQAWAGDKELVTASFFFWLSDNDRLQNSLEGFYRSVLLEILEKCPELTKIIFPKQWHAISTRDDFAVHKQAKFRISELQEAMGNLVESFSTSSDYRFCFFIDGLDEYAGKSIDHLNLARQLRKWAEAPDVKVCASSRPHQEFHSVFDQEARIDLHDLNGEDILLFSRQTLEAENEGHLTREQIKELASEVERRATGVFLWACLIVQSLCEGILHLDCFDTLKGKIGQAPEELMRLFLHLFNKINSADRTRAYQLLLLAAASNDSPDFVLNAMFVSWIDKLEDAEFPYNETRVVYSNEEVTRRIHFAERQLKLTCKGLLEMQPDEMESDEYFRHSIHFLHRSVRDFIQQPHTITAMQQHLGQWASMTSNYARLTVAEIKFARTSLKALKSASSGLRRSFLVACCWAAREHRHRDLEEYEALLRQYKDEPFSLPDSHEEVSHNDGTTAWGFVGVEPSGTTLYAPTQVDISYVHLLVDLGASPDFVMSRVISGAYDNSSKDLCLILCAALSCRESSPRLLQRLLDHGLDFSNELQIYLFSTRGNHYPSQRVSGWAGFLALLGDRICISMFGVRSVMVEKGLWTALEILLRSRRHIDLDVCLELELFDFDSTDWIKARHTPTPITLTLEDMILCGKAQNTAVLLGELKFRKTWGCLADGLVGWAFREVGSRVVQTDTFESMAVETANAVADAAKAAFASAPKPKVDAGRLRLMVKSIRVGDDTFELLGLPCIRKY